LSEVFVEFHQQPVLVLYFKVFVLFLVVKDEGSSFVLKFRLEIVILRYFADGLEIPFHNIALLPHFRKGVPHFIEQVSKGDDSLIRHSLPTISRTIVISFSQRLTGLMSPYPMVSIVVQAK
jgi:hypothetical protein